MNGINEHFTNELNISKEILNQLLSERSIDIKEVYSISCLTSTNPDLQHKSVYFQITTTDREEILVSTLNSLPSKLIENYTIDKSVLTNNELSKIRWAMSSETILPMMSNTSWADWPKVITKEISYGVSLEKALEFTIIEMNESGSRKNDMEAVAMANGFKLATDGTNWDLHENKNNKSPSL